MCAQLLSFCHEHPDVAVHLHVPYFEFEKNDATLLFSSGFLLLDVFRNIDHWSDAPMYQTSLTLSSVMRYKRESIVGKWGCKQKEIIKKHYGQSKNLRFFPMESDGFGMEGFKKSCAKSQRFESLNLVEEDIQGWLDMVADWYKSGL